MFILFCYGSVPPSSSQTLCLPSNHMPSVYRTKKLHEIVNDPVRRAQVKCLVQGPFDSPAKEALKSPTSSVLLVASGIGQFR